MDATDIPGGGLDRQFDQYLVEMKPYVMRLPHKSDRQRSAMWIKKFCEPPSGSTGRKNRNMHAEILLHMLKKGRLEGIFNQRPEPGPLPSLPAYMSSYYEDIHQGAKENVLPDWVTGELASELSDPPPPAVRPWPEVRDRFHNLVRSPTTQQHRSDGMMEWGRERAASPPRGASLPTDTRVPPLHLDDLGAGSRGGRRNLFPDDDSSTTNGDLDFDVARPRTVLTAQQRLENMDDDWKNPSFGSTFLKDNTFRNSTSALPDRESEMKSKMVEARFQEEKLRLQQKHDSNVQKILERKNRELEDLKQHYRNKAREHDTTVAKLEKKVTSLQKELGHVTETRDSQLQELRARAEEEAGRRQQELEKKLQDTQSACEQEKFELQKSQTRAIQELLDDTSRRLGAMEDEYSGQLANMAASSRELEARIAAAAADTQQIAADRDKVKGERDALEERADRLQAQLIDYQARHTAVEKELSALRGEREQEMRALRNKHEANVDFFKQEHAAHAAKTADTISELEQHISQLKAALDRSEQDRAKAVRELEEQHYQERTHLQHLHDTKLKSLQAELEQQAEDAKKQIKKLQENLREQESAMDAAKRTHEERQAQSERALESFKQEVQRSSQQLYDDMKKKMDKVEADLNRSKQLREKQAREHERHLSELSQQHQQQVSEVTRTHEREKSRLVTSHNADREAWQVEHEAQLEVLRQQAGEELGQAEARAGERQAMDAQLASELEEQTHKLREELLAANQLRKQQLVELGLLREEEKQKMLREHEAKVAQLKADWEQQRLGMEKKHSAEIESVVEKTSGRLADIEKEYATRSQRSTDTMNELQKTIDSMRDDMHKLQQEAESRTEKLRHKYDEERRKLKQQAAHTQASLQQELEAQRGHVKQQERRLLSQEQQHEEQVTGVRSQYEERMRGYVTLAVRQELEDTIASLKSQVNSLQQRCALLQEELDYRAKPLKALNSPPAVIGSPPPTSTAKSLA